jgi:chromate reductase, NAD(P)H dehydrogenase (quinone)
MTNMSVPQDLASAPPVGKRILAIAGSLRRGSWNLRLLEAAAECAPAEMTVSVYYDLASIPMFNEDLEQESDGGPDAVRQLRHDVASFDGLLIATPEYNQSIPGVLKNAIDWLSRDYAGEVLVGKPVAIMGASGGRWGTRLAQHALRQTLVATESLVMPGPALFVSQVDRLFSDAGTLDDLPAHEALQGLLRSLTNWIDLVGQPSINNATTAPPATAISR